MSKLFTKERIVFALIIIILVVLYVFELNRKPREVIKTETRVITKEVIKKEYVDRVITKYMDKDTGKLVKVVTVDKSIINSDTNSNEKTKDSEVIKKGNRLFVVSAGYQFKTGTFTAGFGLVFLDTFQIQVIHPVALVFEPALLVSITF
jgi:hypothetical protein